MTARLLLVQSHVANRADYLHILHIQLETKTLETLAGTHAYMLNITDDFNANFSKMKQFMIFTLCIVKAQMSTNDS